jgi:hypothetical protein
MISESNGANSFLISVLLPVFVFLLLACNATIAQTPQIGSESSPIVAPIVESGLQTYSSPDLGISLQLFPQWQIEEQKNAVRLIREQNLVSIDIRVNKLEPSFTDISQYAIEDLNERQKSRADFRLISSEESEISGGNKAYKVVYTFTKKDTGNTDKILRFWILGENNIYTIAYDAKADIYDTYLSEAQNIIDSLQFEDKGDLQSAQVIDQQNQSFTNQVNDDITLPESESSAADPTRINPEFLSYQNDNLRLKFEYPVEWEKQEFGSDIRFVSPSQNEADTFRETIEVKVLPMGSLPFLPSGNLSVSDISDGFLRYYNQTLQSFEIVDSKQTLVGNNEARLLVLKYFDDNTGETQAMNLFTVNRNDIFVFSYYAQPTSYTLYSPIITKMLLSLEIL